MKTDSAPLHGSYFDLLADKHPDLGPSSANGRKPKRPRLSRRRRRTGPLLVVAVGALAGVAWLALALKPASDVLPTAEIQAPVEPARSLADARQEIATAEDSPAPAPGAAIELQAPVEQAPPTTVAAIAQMPAEESPAEASAAALEQIPAEPAPVEPASQAPARKATVASADLPSPAPPDPEPAERREVREPPPATLVLPRAISSHPPVYPESARLAGEEGSVVVEAEIDATGEVSGVRMVRGRSQALDDAAIEALAKWRFEPARRGDVAVASSHRVSFKFALQPQPQAPTAAAATASGEPRAPLVVGGDVQPPRRLSAPLPVYPDAAWAAGVTGDVLVRAVIDESGAVTEVEVLRGLPYGVTEAAVAAIRRWKFAPATRGGQPVAVYRTLSVRFDT